MQRRDRNQHPFWSTIWWDLCSICGPYDPASPTHRSVLCELNPHVGLYGDTREEFVSMGFCVLEAIYVSITREIAKPKMVVNNYRAVRSSGLDEHSKHHK